MSEKSQMNFDDCGAEADDLRTFKRDSRTLDAAELLSKYPEIDAEFIKHVEEFVEQYRPALEALAKR